MSYDGIGFSGAEYRRCPLCGSGMWNGSCENMDCEYHWNSFDENDENEIE